MRVESQRPLQAKLTRSNSVQEMLSSSRTKLFRQSSLQQQRVTHIHAHTFKTVVFLYIYMHCVFSSLFQELEHGLNEQRDLTKAIAIQCSRARTHNQSTDEYTGYLNTHTYLFKYMSTLCNHMTLSDCMQAFSKSE